MKTSVIITIAALALTTTLNAENPFSGNTSSPANRSLLSAIETVEEEYVEVSSWMLDAEAFETEYSDTENHLLAMDDFTETSLKIEEWMLDEYLFTDYEKTIELENWMFDVKDFLNTEDSEEEFLELEEWMLDVKSFR